MMPSRGARISVRRSTSLAALSLSARSNSSPCTSRNCWTTSLIRLARSSVTRRCASPMLCLARAIWDRFWLREPSISATSRCKANRRGFLANPFSNNALRPLSSSLISAICLFSALICPLRPLISSKYWLARRTRMEICPDNAFRRASKILTCPRTASATFGSSRRLSSQSGKRIFSRPSRSATRRASRAPAATRRPLSRSRADRGCVSSRRISTWPAVTLSPSRTKMAPTMPPSRCWTVLRLVSTLTTPGAMAALSSGASAAHPPKTPKNSTMTPSPAATGAVKPM